MLALFGYSRSGRVFLVGARRALPRAPRSPAGRKPVPAFPTRTYHPLPAKRTFRGYSRLRREITSIPPHCSAIFSRKKNAQAHNMTVLRISSYHAAQNHCFSEKQPHIMSFYPDNIIICGGNERAGQAGSEIKNKDVFWGRKDGVMSKFSPAQPGLARKTSHRDRLFPGKAENNLYILFCRGWEMGI